MKSPPVVQIPQGKNILSLGSWTQHHAWLNTHRPLLVRHMHTNTYPPCEWMQSPVDPGFTFLVTGEMIHTYRCQTDTYTNMQLHTLIWDRQEKKQGYINLTSRIVMWCLSVPLHSAKHQFDTWLLWNDKYQWGFFFYPNSDMIEVPPESELHNTNL